MKNGVVKVACGAPMVHLADPVRNATELIRITQKAHLEGASLILYPELSLTGYTCGDLFFNEKLIQSAKDELGRYLEETKHCACVSILGLPLIHEGRLHDCAAVCKSGKLLGIVSKSALSYGESRHFASEKALDARICLFGADVRFGTDGVFDASDFQFEIRMPGDQIDVSKKSVAVVCNMTASPELAGKASRRRQSMLNLSSRNRCCALYTAGGNGESTTDFVFGAHRLICANGEILAEAHPFDFEAEILYSDIDVEQIASMQASSAEAIADIPASDESASDKTDPHPFYPSDPAALEAHCQSILNIQAHGLKHRLQKAYAKKAVIGISGGLDSTLALLVAAHAMDLLGRPRTDILAVTMPCFGTTARTKSNATVLCEELGVEFRCVQLADSVNQHFRDIGHDPTMHDVTYENSQARERTQVLMDIANACGGMVIGTGDLSELALGWATYNGDHMSMYGVNADVPKTLIRHIVAYCASQVQKQGKDTLAVALFDILDTPVSPELLPADEQGEIAQKTEDLVGPYELHDFYLFHLLKHGYTPEKLYRLAKSAFGDTYSDTVLLKWLEVFLRRFFNQQFKRSCLPDGPAVFEISLSPRGSWVMPSDASSAIWLDEVQSLRSK